MNMNWKLVAAFATGAVLASGIVYFSVRPADVSQPPTRSAVASPGPPAIAHTEPAPAVPVPKPIPVREKPSPMPPPVRPRRQVEIAKSIPPAVPLPVEPMPQPTRPPVEATPVPEPPQKVPVQNVSLPAPEVETRVPHTVTLAAGTMLPIRIGESLSAARNQSGDSFLATLTDPLVIDGWIIAERGARVEGRVVDSTPASRGLKISIVRLATADGQNIHIRTEPYVKNAASSTGTDIAKIGGGAAIGAVIGAIAGGGKGAAIGAGAGGVVGAGDVLLTRGKPAEIPVETRVSFRVLDSVTITERLD